MDHGSTWLATSLIYLAAAVIAVPLARALGLGSIIGYLAAGIAIGPWGLKLVTDAQTILSVAEFGVVLMLFLVGLELEPRRLWSMRRPIFGWGSVQMGASAALAMALGVAFGVPWPVALAAALGLAMSSTAIGLAVLGERCRATPARACSRWRCSRTWQRSQSWRCCRCWHRPPHRPPEAAGSVLPRRWQ
jgi:glutathione-regulated potassium-efflux system ancillary protein KefC